MGKKLILKSKGYAIQASWHWLAAAGLPREKVLLIDTLEICQGVNIYLNLQKFQEKTGRSQ